MTHFFDELPLNLANPVVCELTDLLVSNIDDPDEIRDITRRAAMLAGRVDFKKAPYLLWPAVLIQARAEEKHRAVIEEAKRGRAALAKRIDELFSAHPVLPVAAKPGPGSLGGTWQGGSERVLGTRSTLLDIDFLARGVEVSRSVCRLTARDSDGNEWYGSGFLVAPDVVLSNQHVLFCDEGEGPAAAVVDARFFYENGGTPVTVGCDAATIVGDAAFDWAAIRLGSAPPPECRPLRLGSSRPPRRGDPAFIVQHPAGGPKKIGLYRNEVRHVDDKAVQYLTDTQGGSSGSPVFNDRWEVVALHHQWVAATDGSSELRNQGIRIERVIEGLRAHGLLEPGL